MLCAANILLRSSLWPYLSSYVQTSSQLYQVLQPFTMQTLLASLLGLETPTSLPFGRTSNYCFFLFQFLPWLILYLVVAINLDGTVDGQYTFPCP